jgi:formylglycine-generating enzyme required for sulfatase activity
VDWLSRKTGKGYRLLAEAEHEYVTRAGSTTVYWWGSSISTSQANYAGNTGEDRQKTLPVGTFQPNPWGLHELHGNISEWVEDCWNSNYVGAPNDGSAWKTGDCSYRSVRGGSWILGAAYLRSAVRGGAATVFRDNFLGFRVARTLDAVDTPAQRTEAPPPVQQAVVVPPVVPVPPAETAPKPAVGVYPTAREVTPLSPERERALKPKDTFKECDTCPEMVVVPAGSFTMGSAANEKYRDDDEGPQRVVTFSRKFAVGKLPVTWEEWNACVAERVCKDPGHDIKGHGARPATGLSWNDAKVYVAWLSKKTRKSYRLLSEAEREYVARAGTATPYWWGSLYDQSMTDRPNPWGLQRLYHEHREWVEDCYHKNYRGAPTDGSAWTTGACALRVLRGHIGTGLGRPCIGGRPRATQTASATAPTVSA